MFDWTGLVGVVGPTAVVVALVVLGSLSKRLGSVTRTPRYYRGFYIAAALMLVSIIARVVNIGRGVSEAAYLSESPTWVLFYIGFPAVAYTLSVVIAWRYWSWLLAERG
jgi:hypothetical protein